MRKPKTDKYVKNVLSITSNQENAMYVVSTNRQNYKIKYNLYKLAQAVLTTYLDWWLQKQKCVFSQFWKLEVPDQGANTVRFQ